MSPLLLGFATEAVAGFGIPWGTLAAILGLVALLMVAIRMMGQLAVLALDRKEARAAGVRVGAAPIAAGVPSAIANADRRTMVIIAAAVAAAEGARARVLDIRRVQGGNISSQQAWSMEGRREIYLSHRIR